MTNAQQQPETRTAATARPWHWTGYLSIGAHVEKGCELDDSAEDEPGYAFICWLERAPHMRGHGDAIYGPETRANAELIVRAVNAFDALVAALEAVIDADDRACGDALPSWVREEVRAALALARDVICAPGRDSEERGR